MKKSILVTFVGLSVLGLTACGGSSDRGVAINPPPPTQVAPTACGVLKANEQCLQINNRHFMLLKPPHRPLCLRFTAHRRLMAPRRNSMPF